jgi:hypothetical protein
MTKRQQNRESNHQKFLAFLQQQNEYELAEENFSYQNARQIVKLRHKSCGNVFCVKIAKFWLESSRCPNNACIQEHRIPKITRKNSEIENFIKGLGFETSPSEYSVFVPSQKVGIECWKGQARKRAHYDKRKLAYSSGIRLLHFFLDEWKEKRPIAESMIGNLLGCNKNKIMARKCSIEQVSVGEGQAFFKETHISGSGTKPFVVFALKYNGQIACALSLREPFHAAIYPSTIEIARFSSSLNTSVVGGFSRLLAVAQKWAREHDYKKMLSYADLRFGTGNVYAASGFQLIGETVLNYWYSDGVRRYPRQKFRARKDLGKKEREVAEKAGVFKVFGCGNNIYMLDA